MRESAKVVRDKHGLRNSLLAEISAGLVQIGQSVANSWDSLNKLGTAMECVMPRCFSGYCNKWPRQLMLAKTAKKIQRWEGLNYMKKVTTSKLSQGRGFNPKFLRNWHKASWNWHQIPWGRKGLPENWKTIQSLSSDQ